MNKSVSLCALALACSHALPALASSRLEEVIVTSSRIEMPLRQVGTSVTVITSEDIKAQGFSSLYEVLRGQASISANNTGGAGAPTALQIRGEDGHRTLLLIDDIDVSDNSGPQSSPRFEHLLSNGVERVEILRGPQGLLYGADAGGVVSIRTVAPERGLHGSASAEAGRYGTQQIAGDLHGGNETLDYNIIATDFETDGFNSRDTDTTLRDDDGYENTTVHGRLGWNLNENISLQAVVRDTDSNGEYDGCYTANFEPSNKCSYDFEQQARRLSVDVSLGRFKHQLAYSDSDSDRQDYTENLAAFGAEGDLEKWSYLGSFSGGEQLRLVYGAESIEESLDDGILAPERDSDAYYLEYQGEVLQSLYITAGARYDDSDDFGSYTSWRGSAAYIYSLDSGEVKLRSAYGTGFRAPSLYEIAYNAGPWAYPPAQGFELSEEESEGLDVAIAWYGNNGLMLEAGYFDQEISDLIYYDPISYSGYLQDKGTSHSKGIELIADIPLGSAFSLSGNYTYNDTETVDNSSRPRRPEHLANLSLNWKTLDDRLLLGIHVRAARNALDTSGADMDNYEVVNLNANWKVLENLEVYGRVENLLDEDYQEVPTYNTSGAAAYAGVRYSF